eukprot:GGOE01043414.1.p1 GENE.GGOE01043414.1~~GGOE01043414.1.p1  ORF type:complete len:290 (-),score=36.10 GGOE01043414.1:58-927(-)
MSGQCRAYNHTDATVQSWCHLMKLIMAPAKPHLFLASRDSVLLPRWVRFQPYVVTLGPGALVVPSLNPLSTLQPRHYRNASPKERNIFLLAAFSLIYPIRDLLHKQIMAYSGPAEVAREFFDGRTPGRNLMKLMANSVFVLCPPGDWPFQKRFFDTLLNGAIPVVIRRRCRNGVTWFSHLPAENSHRSFFSCPTKWLVKHSYPTLPVPWASLVVEVDLDALLATNFSLVEHLVAVPQREIEEKLERIARVRNWFLYDFEGTTEDAFSILLRNLDSQLRLGKHRTHVPTF